MAHVREREIILVFTGTYAHSIDSKKRLAIPSEVRAQLERAAGQPSQDPVYLYVTLGEGQALCLYTEQGFEQRATELLQSELEPDPLFSYERLFCSLARLVEIDKQGRIRLPEYLLSKAALSSEVVLIGCNDHMEIRDRAAWNEYVEQALATQPQLMNPRRAMRPPRAGG